MILMDGAVNVCECVKMLAHRIAAIFKTNLAEGEGMTVIQSTLKKLSSRQKSNFDLDALSGLSLKNYTSTPSRTGFALKSKR